jgi:heme exporter protein A
MIKKLTPNVNAQLLSCTRGNKVLYSNVNFTLEPGDAIQIQGPNGCGKTSLLKQFCQIIPTYNGEIFIDDVPVRSVKQEFFSLLLYTGHSPAIKKDLTCFENIQYMGLLDGIFDENLLEENLEHLSLSKSRDTLGSDLSRGQSQKTALSRLFFTKRPVWVLDEPFSGLDLSSISVIKKILAKHIQEKNILLITSHENIEIPGVAFKNLEID